MTDCLYLSLALFLLLLLYYYYIYYSPRATLTASSLLTNSYDNTFLVTATSYTKRIKESLRDLLRLVTATSTTATSTSVSGKDITGNSGGSGNVRTREQQLQRAEAEVKSLKERLATVESEFGKGRLQWDSERSILKQTVEECEDKVS